MHRKTFPWTAPLSLPALAPLALSLALASAITMAVSPPARAADPVPAATPARSDTLAPARALIAEGRWRDAIAALQQVNDTGSADWNNLMGYSHRKARTPDLMAAARYYESALRIDANHRGALEYAGELALMQGDLTLAEQRAAALSKACGGRCEELDDLKDAITRFKANGNRYVEK